MEQSVEVAGGPSQLVHTAGVMGSDQFSTTALLADRSSRHGSARPTATTACTRGASVSAAGIRVLMPFLTTISVPAVDGGFRNRLV